MQPFSSIADKILILLGNSPDLWAPIDCNLFTSIRQSELSRQKSFLDVPESQIGETNRRVGNHRDDLQSRKILLRETCEMAAPINRRRFDRPAGDELKENQIFPGRVGVLRQAELGQRARSGGEGESILLNQLDQMRVGATHEAMGHQSAVEVGPIWSVLHCGVALSRLMQRLGDLNIVGPVSG